MKCNQTVAFLICGYLGCVVKEVFVKDIRKSPYAEWLENMLGDIMEYEPTQIGICMVLPSGAVATAYWGPVSHADKALMAYNMTLDSVMDVVTANAKDIVAASDEQDFEEDADE